MRGTHQQSNRSYHDMTSDAPSQEENGKEGGANEEEASTFPDNTIEFVNRMNGSIELGCMNEVRLVAPFHDKQKEEIAEFLLSKDASIEFSSSCYLLV